MHGRPGVRDDGLLVGAWHVGDVLRVQEPRDVELLLRHVEDPLEVLKRVELGDALELKPGRP